MVVEAVGVEDLSEDLLVVLLVVLLEAPWEGLWVVPWVVPWGARVVGHEEQLQVLVR